MIQTCHIYKILNRWLILNCVGTFKNIMIYLQILKMKIVKILIPRKLVVQIMLINIVTMSTWRKIAERLVDIVNHVKGRAKLIITKGMVIVMMETTIVDVNMMVVIVVIPMQIWITAQNVNVLKLLHLMPKIRWKKFFSMHRFYYQISVFYSKLSTFKSSELLMCIRILLTRS